MSHCPCESGGALRLPPHAKTLGAGRRAGDAVARKTRLTRGRGPAQRSEACTGIHGQFNDAQHHARAIPERVVPGAFAGLAVKALKYLAGITLATIGVVFTVGPVVDAFNPQSEWYWWMNAGMFVVLGLLPLAGAVALLKRGATEIPPRRCPRCGSPEQAPAGVLRRSGFWVHLLIWPLGLLWRTSRRQQVRCLQCDELYFTETRGVRIACILLWVFLLLLLLGAIAEHLQERP